ncbi:MAG TPA: adenylate/guanylate cyclase domain-containing protein [Acidimicrobiales bacterium]|nr:adenylate/guanylate cyclase domain-containing protein [Acidimicrobiales bacterium]
MAITRVALPAFIGFIGIAVPCVLLVIASGEVDDDTSLPLTITLVAFAGCVMVPLIWYSFRALPLWSIHVMALICDVLIVGACFAVGVRWSPIAAALAWVVLGTMIFLIGQLRVAIVHLVPIGAGYAFVVASQDGNSAPLARWLGIMGIIALTGVTVSNLMERTRQLAVAARKARDAEHAALEVAERAHMQLAELNATLEARVIDQVDELGRLSGLRRFLSAPVADAVLSGDVSVLEPHRRQIAVLFCDLRGFTSFASGAEPEDVVDVLDDYYRTVGDVIRRYEATVGTFAGDGVMAYLGDPVPCDDPAGKVVAMAVDLREPLRRLTGSWTRLGRPIGYGIGIAYGYATLGMIGFEGRNDYTALGSVVNLAARLCEGAADGEVLIDGRTYDEVRGAVEADLVEVTVKGLTDPVTAYRVSVP